MTSLVLAILIFIMGSLVSLSFLNELVRFIGVAVSGALTFIPVICFAAQSLKVEIKINLRKAEWKEKEVDRINEVNSLILEKQKELQQHRETVRLKSTGK